MKGKGVELVGILKSKFHEIENLVRLGEGNTAAYQRTKEIIENSYDPKWMCVVAKETMYADLSQKASERAAFLSSLSRRDRKRLEKEHKEKKTEQDTQAQKDREKFNESAQDQSRPEHWLKKLFEWYARENDLGRQQIEEHLLAYGDSVYPIVKEYIFSLATQYHDFTAPITEIRYGSDEGRRTKAVIDVFTNGMKYGIVFLGKFKHPNRIRDITSFYQFIRQNIYSDPHSGFGDMFNAVKIRQQAVRAMGVATENHEESAAFYITVLDDASCFVRWEAIDILKDQWKPEEITVNTSLRQALEKAATKEDNGVSNRKRKLSYLLGKERL